MFYHITFTHLFSTYSFFQGCDSGTPFQKQTSKLFFPCSFACRGAVSMETGCDRDTCLRLEPADHGERVRVHWLWKGKRAWDDGGSRERGGESWAQLQGGVETLLFICVTLVRTSVRTFSRREKCHKMKNLHCLSVYENRSPEIWQNQRCLILQVNFTFKIHDTAECEFKPVN